MLSIQEALNEIAKQLIIHNEIQLLQLTKQYDFSSIINIQQELKTSKDKIEAELPPYEKPKNIFEEQQDAATKN